VARVVSFRRRLGELETLEWEECLSTLQLNEDDDSVQWDLTKNDQFSVASLYKHCAFLGVIDVRMKELWHTKMSLKVKIVVWLVYQNRVQTSNSLIKKKWKRESKSKLCLSEESVERMIFTTVFCVGVIKEEMKWERIPKSVKQFNDDCLLERDNKNNGVLGMVCWTSLWLNRNDLVFRTRLVAYPNAILYKSLFFMQG
jgi:hypothetical protein